MGEDETLPCFGRRASVSNQSDSQRALVNHGEQDRQFSWLGTQIALMCERKKPSTSWTACLWTLEKELKAEREAQRERVT